uniref:Putative secreted effector protein CSEP007 n=1 Tax=Podosphaera xanthii TaxID=135283 RepID=A0A2U7MKB0_9PEZI|nr:putative secreted effector protein CSEP007 [Podosphaera xanthii]
MLAIKTSSLVLFLSIVTTGFGSPTPCPEKTRDLILRGDLDPSACCSIGLCKRGIFILPD